MYNTIEILRSIITISNTYSVQLNTHIKELSYTIDQLVTNTQSELLTKISNDYNINYKELQRKYIGKSKKNKKNIGDLISENDEEQECKNEKTTGINVEQNNHVETIFKKIKIKNNTYLLKVDTNELYDMENNIVGKKLGNKYMLKK